MSWATQNSSRITTPRNPSSFLIPFSNKLKSSKIIKAKKPSRLESRWSLKRIFYFGKKTTNESLKYPHYFTPKKSSSKTVAAVDPADLPWYFLPYRRSSISATLTYSPNKSKSENKIKWTILRRLSSGFFFTPFWVAPKFFTSVNLKSVISGHKIFSWTNKVR